MSEYLEKKCMNLGIRLVYTYNKTTVLSIEINNKKPLLIADMLFKNCPDSISKAIIGFYTDIKSKDTHEKIIKDYVAEYFFPYAPGKIKHFDLSFLINSAQSTETNYKVKADGGQNDKHKTNIGNVNIKNIDINDPNLVEFDISYINRANFWGAEEQYKSNTAIKPSRDDEMELNIVVLPPNT